MTAASVPASARHARAPRAPGLLLGLGLGGFLDGIVLHQIVQWHHMLTSTTGHPMTTLAGLETNTLADGFFHLATWAFVGAATVLTVQAWQRGEMAPPWRTHIGLVLTGWGVFNLVEGIIDHQLLGIHHVRDDLGGPIGWDIGFLVFGALLILGGWWLVRIRGADRGRGPKADALIRFRRGEGRPLVLLHGLGLSWRSWKPVLPLLTGRREVLALDLPGFGEAAPLDEPPTIAALADAVDAELTGARIERMAIAGNSLGGSVGLELARRGRASSVVVLGPAGMETQAERAGVIALNETQRALYAALAPAAATLTANPVSRTALLGWLHGRPWRIAADDGAAEIRDFARAPQFHATLRHATSTWNPSQLSQIGVPIRVCVGSRDLLLGAPNAPRYGAAIPGAQVSWLPGCGHVPMADDPEMIADVILAGSRPRARARPGSHPGPRT